MELGRGPEHSAPCTPSRVEGSLRPGGLMLPGAGPHRPRRLPSRLQPVPSLGHHPGSSPAVCMTVPLSQEKQGNKGQCAQRAPSPSGVPGLQNT